MFIVFFYCLSNYKKRGVIYLDEVKMKLYILGRI